MSSAGHPFNDINDNKAASNDCSISDDFVTCVFLQSSNSQETQQIISSAVHANNFEVCNSKDVNTIVKTIVGLNEAQQNGNLIYTAPQNGVIVTLSDSASNVVNVNSTSQQPSSLVWASTQSRCEPQFCSPVNLTSLAAAVTDLVTVQNFQGINPNVLRSSFQNGQSADLLTISSHAKTEKRKFLAKRKRFQQYDINADDDDDEDSNTSTKEKQQKMLSPFAPEATVPLPFQLNYFGSLSTTIWKRNERERYRVRCVNEGYERLRSHLPIPEHEKKLSKVDTLRLAIYYIHHLQFMLYEEGHASNCNCFVNFNSERQETLMQNSNSSDPSSAD